jgi:hypothetical protein
MLVEPGSLGFPPLINIRNIARPTALLSRHLSKGNLAKETNK